MIFFCISLPFKMKKKRYFLILIQFKYFAPLYAEINKINLLFGRMVWNRGITRWRD